MLPHQVRRGGEDGETVTTQRDEDGGGKGCDPGELLRFCQLERRLRPNNDRLTGLLSPSLSVCVEMRSMTTDPSGFGARTRHVWSGYASQSPRHRASEDRIRHALSQRLETDPVNRFVIQVDLATWSKAGQLDWWVRERRERREWWGRVRGADGRQRSIKAVDLRPASGSQR